MSYNITEADSIFANMAFLMEKLKGEIGIIITDQYGKIIFNTSGNNAYNELFSLYIGLEGKIVYLSHNKNQDLINKIYKLNPITVLSYENNPKILEQKKYNSNNSNNNSNNIKKMDKYRMALFFDSSSLKIVVDAIEVSNDMCTLPGFISWLGSAYAIDLKSDTIKGLCSQEIINNSGKFKYRIAILKSSTGSIYIQSATSKKSHDEIEKNKGFIKWNEDWNEFKFTH